MADPGPADPVVETARMSRGPRLSIAWLVPLLALVVSLGVAWRSYSDRGPIVEILFENAAGIIPGETTLRFRDFTIGVVEGVGFTSDLEQVVVRARIQRDMARFIDDTATFWLVRARVGPAGITGLETVLTGAFIEAAFDNIEGEPVRRFTALPNPPLTPAGQPGMRVTLQSITGGSIATGAPILYKQIAVGTIESVDLTPEGDVTVSAFIAAPHHERLSTATRFWNASGLTFNIGATGASLRVDSLASLVQGGIAFDTIAGSGEPVDEDEVFHLYATENDALNSVLTGADWSTPVRLRAVFDGSVRGLRLGADVEYRGVRVGEVAGIQAILNDAPDGSRILLQVNFDVLPNRFGIPESDDAEERLLDLIEEGVARGLRAQIASQGLFGTNLYVNLIEMPGLPPAEFDRTEEPVPFVPAAPVEASDMVSAATGVMQRLSSLPLEDVVQNAATLLASINTVVSDENVRQAPAELGLLIGEIRELVQGDAMQAAPAELAAVLASVRVVVDDLARQEVASSLTEALTAATRTMESVGVAADGVPAMLDGVTGQIRDLPLQATVEELQRLLTDLREGGAVENTNATLAAIRAVTEQIATARLAESLGSTLAAVDSAVADVATATGGLPDLLSSLTSLSEEARALPLSDMVATATRLVENVDGFVTNESVAALPAGIEAAVNDLRGVLTELRAEDGAIVNATAALASIRDITDQVAQARLADSLVRTLSAVEGAVSTVDTASEGLPQLLNSLTALSDRARALPLDELVATAAHTLATADAFIASEAVTEVPQSVNTALAELRLILAELRAGGAVDNVNATLASVRALTDELATAQLAESLRNTLAAAERAAASVDTATVGLPELVDNLTALSQDMQELPLAELVASGRQVLDTADELLGSEGMADVPPQLAGALAELRLSLAELREGGAVENLNTTLASADEAAEAVASAAAALPALVTQLAQTAARADQALGSYGPGSDINRDALLLLRELRDAARSVNSLVTALERRPNSVLFGR